MLIKKKYIFTLFTLLGFLFLPAISSAATPAELRDKYNNALTTGNKVKILIVPGHDDDYWGTEFGDIREGDITVAIGQYLYDYLKNDPRLDVTITRTQLTGYTDTFKSYFDTHKQEIQNFITTSHNDFASKLQSGAVSQIDSNVPHANANSTVAFRLYGINKWANDNNVDITLHIHINDEGGRQYGVIGDYNGFAIYVPYSQFTHSGAADAFGEALYNELKLNNKVSTYPPESKGLIEDQDLIATGANDTTKSAVSLVEYGYIYEPQFRSLAIQEDVTKSLAYQTFLGIHRFFGDRDVYAKFVPAPKAATVTTTTTTTSSSKYLPFTWKKDMEKGDENKDVSALQAALTKSGVYSCGVVGTYGPCTVKGVIAFQKKYKISQTGVVGPLTRAKLNALYSK